MGIISFCRIVVLNEITVHGRFLRFYRRPTAGVTRTNSVRKVLSLVFLTLALCCEFCIVRAKLMCCREAEMMQSIWWESLPLWLLLVHCVYRSNPITRVQYRHMFRGHLSAWDGPTPTWRHALSWIQVWIILNRYRKTCIYNNLIKWVGGQFFRKKKKITDFPERFVAELFFKGHSLCI